jgi:HSP20 family protein
MSSAKLAKNILFIIFNNMNERRLQLIDPARVWQANLWNDLFNDVKVSNAGEIEMYEDDDDVVVKMKAAGFNPEDIDISIEGKLLTITGKVEEEFKEEDKKRKYYYREMRNESFTRSISLPTSVKSDSVKAEFKNGILKISMPKIEEVKPKKISISVN